MSDTYTPTVAAFRGVYGQMCAEWCRDDALAEFDRFIARIKAEAVAEALLSEESIERAALGIHASHDRGDWDEELPVVQEEYLDMARAALAAALGEDESNE